MGIDTTPIKEAIEKTFGPKSDFYWLERIILNKSGGPWGSNVKFITTMGTVADEVIEVIKAAETLCKSDGDHMYPHRLKLSEALVALQKKRMEVL